MAPQKTGSYMEMFPFDGPEQALHACIENQDLQQLQVRIRQLPASINYNHPVWGSPLYFAVHRGDLEAVDMLVSAGADVALISTCNNEGPAISLAARNGYRDILKILWRQDTPEQHICNLSFRTNPLVLAATHGKTSVVLDLLDWWDGWGDQLQEQALIGAARQWHYAVVELLLSRFTYPDAIIQDCLEHAVAHKYTRDEGTLFLTYEESEYIDQQLLITLLVRHGADPDSSKSGVPLLVQIAEFEDMVGALKASLDNGADHGKTSQHGDSALNTVSRSSVDVTQLQG